MKILGYHIEPGIIANSDNEIATTNPLPFLLEPKEDTIKVFWNLNYSLAVLLKMLDCPEGLGEKLWETGEAEHLVLDGHMGYPYRLGYVPSKFLSVKYGRSYGSPFSAYSDMEQYHKEGIDDKEKTVAYCLEKAGKAKQTGEQVYQALRSLSLNPTTLTSPVRAYEKEVLSKLDIPTVDDLPPEVAELAYRCCHGGWLEAFKRGYWPEAFDYDVNSCYAYHLSLLPDTRQGTWLQANERPPDVILGFLQGRVYIDTYLSPILYEHRDEELYTPTGEWETVLTQAEVDFIQEHKLGTFELESGWWWVPDSKKVQTRPFWSMIDDLYNIKEQSEGLDREVAKRVLAGLWGKTLEIRKGNFGVYFNPVYGALVETNTRLDVAEFCLQAIREGCNPIHIAVDGVILDKPAWFPNIDDTGLGQWRLSSQGPCIVVSSGIVGMSGKEKLANDFSLNYDKLSALLEASPNDMSYKMVKLGFMSLGRALAENKWDRLGSIEEVSRIIDISYEGKRDTANPPMTGKDILSNQYNTEPWDMTLLEGVPI